MRIPFKSLLATATILAITPTAFANPSSRMGTEIKGISAGGALSLAYGWRYVSFESDHFFLGGAAFTGHGKGGGNLTMGGMVSGYQRDLGSSAHFDFSLLAGAITNRAAAGTAEGGLTLEPTLNLGLILGPSVRTVFNGGYAWTPGATNMSGLTYGLRFEFLLNPSTK